MHRVRVKLTGRKDISYDVIVKAGLFDGDLIKLPYKASTFAIISDSRVANIYGKKLIKKLIKNGLKCHILAFPAGERSKSRSVKEKIEDKLFSLKFGRDGSIISLGGGVTGDLAGHNAVRCGLSQPCLELPRTLAIGAFVHHVGKMMRTEDGLKRRYGIKAPQLLKELKVYREDMREIVKDVEQAGLLRIYETRLC